VTRLRQTLKMDAEYPEMYT